MPPKKKTARYYAKNPKALAKKRAYDRKYKKGVGNPKAKSQAKERHDHWSERRRRKKRGQNLKGKDLSTVGRGKKKRLVLKSSSKNRASKSDQPGDRKARGKGNKKKRKSSSKKKSYKNKTKKKRRNAKRKNRSTGRRTRRRK